MRLIDADAFNAEYLRQKEMLGHRVNNIIIGDETALMMLLVLDAMPTVDAVPVRHGRWIEASYIFPHYECSVCGTISRIETVMGTPWAKYCPHCGARMDLSLEKTSDKDGVE